MTKVNLGLLLLPEILVVLAGFAGLLVDMLFMRARPVPVRMRTAMVVAVLGCAGAMLCLARSGGAAVTLYDGAVAVNLLTQLVKQIILILTIFTAIISIDARFTAHVGEYFLLVLLAAAGAMFLISAENLLMIFVALELLSLCLYMLTAFNKANVRSVEAALKYFLFGGMSAAFMLFGLSLVYGLSGSLQLQEIATALRAPRMDPLLMVALIMTVIGFGFKIAVVPFHLWAPDAYEGAPMPSAAFIASASKVASFFILAKVMMVGFAGAEGSGGWNEFSPGWVGVLAITSLLSVVLGNLAAIAQRSVRRLLAYSAVAHAGYALLGILSNDAQGMASVLYYMSTYGLTILGAFAVVGSVQEASGEERFSAFAGLGRRAPLLAFCMMIFMLSLAGIPPLAGFFGKFYLFTAALATAPQKLDLLWLVSVAVAMSAVSLYYYLQVLKQIYVVEPARETPALAVGPITKVAIAALALSVVVLGCLPHLLIEPLLAAIKAAGG